MSADKKVRTDVAWAPYLRLKAAREALGLSLSEMAKRLQLRGTQAKDDLRKMEEGVRPVTGPVLVAAELMAANSWLPEPVAYLRDLDGTGSLHVCAKGDPGARPVFASANPYTFTWPTSGANDPDFADLMVEVAENSTTDETPGVADDPLGDQIVMLAREWVKVNGGGR
jgi:transcriptional regulator with XRE-family HTH domain